MMTNVLWGLRYFQLAIASPKWEVIHKLKAANFVRTIGGRVFLTVSEAVIKCKLDQV